MSIVFELCKSSGKKVCPPFHVRNGNCPLIVRSTSEDLITSNVFGVLKNLDPNVWLPRLLGEAIKGKDFGQESFKSLSFEFWKKLKPPTGRIQREGRSEIDLVISYDDTVIFIEAKYLASVSLRTTHDAYRDQVIRYLDLAAHHVLVCQKESRKFYLILIEDTEKPPWVLQRYRQPRNIATGLADLGFFGDKEDICKRLSEGIGWLSWAIIQDLLSRVREDFKTDVEKRFIDDLNSYLGYKIREAERIRNERKQLNLW